MNAADVLPRLQGVRKISGGWVAKCPSHDDGSPSLTLADRDDGGILLHCFAGCSIGEITGALGLEVSDLFPPRDSFGAPRRWKHAPADLLYTLGTQAEILRLAAIQLMDGIPLTADDCRSLLLAYRKIIAVQEACQ